jgi:transposase-like protein
VYFKGSHFPKDVILKAVRWYTAYPLSYRHVEELMEERGINVDHATVNRWVIKYSPVFEAQFRQVKYLNNLIEQDHRGIKRIVKPMLGFKNFLCAAATLAGIELYHMIRKGQNALKGSLSAWEQFYALAA